MHNSLPSDHIHFTIKDPQGYEISLREGTDTTLGLRHIIYRRGNIPSFDLLKKAINTPYKDSIWINGDCSVYYTIDDEKYGNDQAPFIRVLVTINKRLRTGEIVTLYPVDRCPISSEEKKRWKKN